MLTPAKRRWGIALGIVLIPAVLFALYCLFWLVDRYWFRLS